MACGTPCVTYDVPAVREVLADGEAGVLVASRDVACLAAAIEKAIDDVPYRQRLIAVGRRRAMQYFAAAPFADRMETVYRRGS
jgi:glycosyltransferase involved in cell wall biosynthesis